jgi:predicted MFS family arabinose efflux permease
MVALWGGAAAFIVIGLAFAAAAMVIARVPEPATESVSTGSLVHDAWQGLIYAWRNPTLRALGFSLSTLNLGWGALTILTPLIVLERLRLNETAVGFLFALNGLGGMTSVIFVGRMDTRGRERRMLAWSMAGMGAALALILWKSNFIALVIVMAVTGLLSGPLDIALFTLRQRRTPPAWVGRAFAISMAFNYAGMPVGSALGGIIAARSVEAAIAFSVLASLLSAVLAAVMIPGKAR